MLPIASLKGAGTTSRPAQPPQDPGRRRTGRLHAGSQNLIEPGYDKPKNQKARPRVGGPDGPRHRSASCASSTSSSPPTGTPRPARTSPRRLGRSRPFPPRPDAVTRRRRQVVPSGPGFVTENNLRLFNSMIYSRSTSAVADQPLLRARRVAAVRRDDGRPARRRRRALRLGARPTSSWWPTRSAPTTRPLLEAGVRIWLYPAPVRPARQALHRRRRPRRDRVLEHGLPLVRAQLRGRDDVDSRDVVRRLRAVQDELPVAVDASSPWRSGASAVAGASYVDNVMRLTAALQ